MIVNPIQRAVLLNGAFTEGWLTDDQRAAVVLHGSGEDLRCRCTEAVNQNHQRAFVVDHTVIVRIFSHFTVVIAHLNHRARWDEQARE